MWKEYVYILTVCLLRNIHIPHMHLFCYARNHLLCAANISLSSAAIQQYRRMAIHLLEHHVTMQKPGRNSLPFKDITSDGFKKMSLTWLKHVLAQTEGSEDDNEQQSMPKEVDLDYEMFNVV